MVKAAGERMYGADRDTSMSMLSDKLSRDLTPTFLCFQAALLPFTCGIRQMQVELFDVLRVLSPVKLLS